MLGPDARDPSREGPPRSPDHECRSPLVVDVGLPRSGTTSWIAFMHDVGYKTHKNLPGISLRDFQEFQDAGRTGGKCPPDTNPFMGLEPHNGTLEAYADVPMYGLACSFAKCYPHALLVSSERDVETWVPSAKYMFCKWYDCENLKRGNDHEQIQRLIFGDAVDSFCAHRETERPDERLCADDGSATESRQWADVEAKLRTFHAAHHESLRCVDVIRDQQLIFEGIGTFGRSRLLRFNLGDSNAASQLAEFLGCEGPVPKFKHLNPEPNAQEMRRSAELARAKEDRAYEEWTGNTSTASQDVPPRGIDAQTWEHHRRLTRKSWRGRGVPVEPDEAHRDAMRPVRRPPPYHSRDSRTKHRYHTFGGEE